MIPTFENETSELTKQEMSMVRPISNGLRTKVGQDQAVSSSYIMERMSKDYPKLSGARLRKIIHFIRHTRLVPRLCATSKGYFVAENDKELDIYLDSLFRRILIEIELLKSYRADTAGKVDELERQMIKFINGTKPQ